MRLDDLSIVKDLKDRRDKLQTVLAALGGSFDSITVVFEGSRYSIFDVIPKDAVKVVFGKLIDEELKANSAALSKLGVKLAQD